MWQGKAEIESQNQEDFEFNPDVKDIFSFKFEDFELVGYDPHPHIKAAVAI